MNLAPSSPYFSFHAASSCSLVVCAFFWSRVSLIFHSFRNWDATYVSPGAQLSAVDGILVETLPLLELPLSKGLVLFRIPYEHFWLVVDTGGFAYSLDHA
jgi:hypothetical protein